MGYFSPTDQWPQHSKKWFREVLKVARRLGWSLEANSNHGTLKLSCPAGAPECQRLIFSTGRGGESVAKSHMRAVKRCRHGVADNLTKAMALLDKAERLIEAVFTLHERDTTEQRALALLYADDCEETEIEELLGACDQLARQADELLADDANGDEPTAVLAAANGALSETRILLKPLPTRNSDVRAQRERLRKLEVRVTEARGFISIS